LARYSDVLRRRLQLLREEKAMRDRGEDPRRMIKTGLREFDEKAGGIERSILTVVGAPTGEGKTFFKKHVQETAARAGLKCLDLSFEDPPPQTADRTLSTLTGIDNDNLAKGFYDNADLDRIAFALEDISWADNIDYRYGLKSPDECLEILEESDADLASIDYAQAFPDGEKGLERTIRDFAWAASENAQKKKRAICIYSQLVGEVEQRGIARVEASRRFGKEGEIDCGGFRPQQPGDLAWSRALGQRAKCILFLFRLNRYLRKYGVNAPDNRMEIIAAKRSFGKEGRIIVGFDGATATLYDLNEKEA
jgi:replicative DNA helicase